MLAAELRVKKAVMPDSRKHVNTNGYGLRRVTENTMSGLTNSATINIEPTNIITRLLNCSSASKPVVATVLATNPKIPKGASLMTTLTIQEMALAISCTTTLVELLAFSTQIQGLIPKPEYQ